MRDFAKMRDIVPRSLAPVAETTLIAESSGRKGWP